MKRLNKKTVKLLAIILSVAVILALIAVLLSLNWHRIFLFAEENGIFCNPIEISDISELDTYMLSIDEIKNDGRISIDQSLMLINKEFLLPNDFAPEVSEYKTTTVYMNDCMISAYAEMSADISKRFGKKLYVSSDFRSAEEQAQLYLDDPLTATMVGASEHQSGLALDVYVAYFSGDGFIKSPIGRFVNRYCHRYGFIIRYPSFGEEITAIRFEPWHIRYVGQPHASIIYNNHLTLEEYILSMEIGVWKMADGYLISRQGIDENGRLELPKNFESCTISPDNTGYYIITVK